MRALLWRVFFHCLLNEFQFSGLQNINRHRLSLPKYQSCWWESTCYFKGIARYRNAEQHNRYACKSPKLPRGSRSMIPTLNDLGRRLICWNSCSLQKVTLMIELRLRLHIFGFSYIWRINFHFHWRSLSTNLLKTWVWPRKAKHPNAWQCKRRNFYVELPLC